MADANNTLNLGSLRPTPVPPEPKTTPDHGPAKHPEAAEAARARIEAAGPSLVLPHDPSQPIAPAHPTAELVTDKHALASQFRKEPQVRGPKLPAWLRPLLTAVGVFFLVLLMFKIPVIYSQAQYVMNSQATPAAAPAVAPTEVVPAANTISIPKINVVAPVNYEPSVQEAAIQKSLETGVVHYGNTAKPGEIGNAAIFGHSSNDWWEPGNYKFVFVLLDKLAPGDQITIDYQSKRYVYEVTGSKVVEPTNMSVLDQTPTPTLSIITCTPPGTSLKRLVVTAKQISPSPDTAIATAAAAGSASGSLPSGSASNSFFDQLTKTWSDLTAMFSGGSTPKADPTPAPVQ